MVVADELRVYFGELRAEKRLFQARPNGQWNEQQLIWITHVLHGRNE